MSDGPLEFLIHPAEAEDAEYTEALRSTGLDVLVMPYVNGPTYPLDAWLAAIPSVRALIAWSGVPPAG